MEDLRDKLEKLKSILSGMESTLIAYSGGADSNFLLKVAKDVLRDKVLAVTADSETYPPGEIEEAKRNASEIGAEHIIINTEELEDKNFSSNSPARCYYCKKELFTRLLEIAEDRGLNYVVSGSNYDDIKDYRPGMGAANELGVRSPLKEAVLTKDEIRTLSREMGLVTWDKPAFPCLSTRFPYGSEITKEKLLKVAEAEEFLSRFGLKQLRIRVHDDIARIEVPLEEKVLFFEEDTCKRIVEGLKSIGYTYVTLDLEGYRMGSMNETLKKGNKSG